MIEIPARFSDQPAAHPQQTGLKWNSVNIGVGIQGLVEDFQYYGTLGSGAG